MTATRDLAFTGRVRPATARALSVPGRGRAASHSFLLTDPRGSRPFRWEACDTITYRLNLSLAPVGAAKEARQALLRLTAELYDGFVLLDAGLYRQLDKGFTAGRPYGWSMGLGARRRRCEAGPAGSWWHGRSRASGHVPGHAGVAPPRNAALY